MNLETIEQKCLAYLGQVSNPLAQFSNVVLHLRNDEDCPEFAERDLLAFLREHELFTVIDPPQGQEDPEADRELDDLGIPPGPRVILASRVPTKDELGSLIQQQLTTMSEALAGAMDQANQMGDKDAQDQVLDVMSRANKLKEMMRRMFEK